MARNRHRQKDPVGVGNSNSNSDDDDSKGSCEHFKESMHADHLSRRFSRSPITNCDSCVREKCVVPKEKRAFHICLKCGNVYCGKDDKDHALKHQDIRNDVPHCLLIDSKEWKIWCYLCSSFVYPNDEGHIKQVKQIKEKIDSALLKGEKIVKQSNSSPAAEEISNQDIVNKYKLQKHNMCQDNSLKFPKVKGLVNLGNTCFFNSVLQNLSQTPYLVKVLQDLQVPGQIVVLPGRPLDKCKDEDKELESIEGELEDLENKSLTIVLLKTLVELQADNTNTFRPIELLNTLRSKTSQCTDGDQHDSHELLRHLLELVRNEDLKRYQTVILSKCDLNHKSKRKMIPDDLKRTVKFFGNQASMKFLGPERVFRGELVSTLECKECGHTSCRTEPFLDLSLPISMECPVDSSKIVSSFYNTKDNGDFFQTLKLKYTRPSQLNTGGNDIDSNETNDSNKSKENDKADLEGENAINDKNENYEEECWDSEPVNGSKTYEYNLKADSNHKKEDKNSNVTNLLANCHMPILDPATNDCYDSQTANNENNSPSPTDVSMTDLTQEKSDTDEESASKIATNSKVLNFLKGAEKNPDQNLLDGDNPDQGDTSPDDDIFTNDESPKSLTTKTNCLPNNCGGYGNTDKIDITDGNDTNFSLYYSHNSRCRSVNPIIESGTSADLNVAAEVDNSIIDCGRSARGFTRPLSDRFNSYSSTEEFKESIEFKHSKLNSEPQITSYKPLNEDDFDKIISPSRSEVNGVQDSQCILKLDLEESNDLSTHAAPSGYDVPPGECSIQSCLNTFTNLEIMDGKNVVACEKCSEREKLKTGSSKVVCTKSTKQYLISQVPAVLILHLKRFQMQKYCFRKVGKHVSFPMVFDLAPVCKNPAKRRIYSLFGIVEHSGSLNFGHYVAYVKSRAPLKENDPRWEFLPTKDGFEYENDVTDSDLESQNIEDIKPPPGQWYYISDSRVQKIDEKSVLQKEAYLLFYERIL